MINMLFFMVPKIVTLFSNFFMLSFSGFHLPAQHTIVVGVQSCKCILHRRKVHWETTNKVVLCPAKWLWWTKIRPSPQMRTITQHFLLRVFFSVGCETWVQKTILKKILKFAIPKISDTRWKTPLMNSVVVYPSHGHGSKLGILRMRQVTVENDQHMLVPKPSNLNHTHTPKWPQNSKNESCSAVWSVAAITESTKFLPKLLWFAKIPKASEFGSLDSEFQKCPWKRPQISAVQKNEANFWLQMFEHIIRLKMICKMLTAICTEKVLANEPNRTQPRPFTISDFKNNHNFNGF